MQYAQNIATLFCVEVIMFQVWNIMSSSLYIVETIQFCSLLDDSINQHAQSWIEWRIEF